MLVEGNLTLLALIFHPLGHFRPAIRLRPPIRHRHLAPLGVVPLLLPFDCGT